MADELVFFSPLPRAECTARLEAALKAKAFGLIGRVYDDSLRLQKAKAPFSRNLAPWRRLVGEIDDWRGGTRLQVRIKPSFEVLLFSTIWILFVGKAVLDTGAVGVLLMLPVLPVALAFGWRSSEDERTALLDFLRQTVEAEPLEAEG